MARDEKTKEIKEGRIAPERELRAGLWLLYLATAHARNLARDEKVPAKKIEDLMEAINDLPNLLMNWEEFDEREVMARLSTYDDRWSKKTDPVSLVDLWEMSKEKFLR